MFDPIDPRQSFSALEHGILAYWKDEDIFRRSIAEREGCENFSFYDGPPFATGTPHYGHLLGGTIKDVIPRYQTMKGKKVERRFGWDCHGLPVEYEIEKEHDIKGRQDIEEMGVPAFNDLCRGIVQRYTKEWRKTVERMGRWVDMDHDYRTMDPDYMESIWWVFKSLHEKGLIYEGYKPMHVCPRCVTPLSNFEVTQGYKDVTDQSATVKFKLADLPSPVGSGQAGRGVGGEADTTYFLAWTTTPWTLPGNLFLAVHPDTDYVKVRCDGAQYIVAEALAGKVFKDREHEISGKSFKGATLIGTSYTPLFPYFADQYKDSFKVVAGDFVTTTDGTGIVHIAPGFGEDDFSVGLKIFGKDYQPLQHVKMDGKFVAEVTDFAGMDVKPKDDPTKTDKKVIQFLEQHNGLFSIENYRHSYPHCWRCDSPLLNYATGSWFVKVEKIKNDMLLVNAETEWVPAHLRDGRFGKWLENAHDWAISRNRYWGTPLPIWRAEGSKDLEVITSRDDLMRRKLIRFTKVSVLRHAESEGNLVPMYQGTVPGTPLTAKGKGQADAAAAYLSEAGQLPVSVIYSSPMARTLSTAEAIAKATGARIIIDERLREIDMGEHEGKTIPFHDLEVSKQLRKEKAEMNLPQSTFHLPGMEPWASVQMRMKDFFDDVLPKHRSEHIVVVSHGDPIFNIRHYFTKEDPLKLVQLKHADHAVPAAFFWDHKKQAQMDLHKDVIDDITWNGSPSSESVELTLVRHGETDLNKQRIVQGSEIDASLNEEGHRQAEALAKTLKKGQFDVIISSHMKRAVETADYLANALGIAHEDKLEILRERDFGEWSGRNIDELLTENPPVMEGIFPAMNHHTNPKGESLQQFFDRAEDILQMIRTKYAGKRVLLVAHGGTMLAVRLIAENRSYRDVPTMSVKNTETVAIGVHPVVKRIPDVLDCWFESGSMPYAQGHYPFEMRSSGLGSTKSEARNPNETHNSQFSILNSQLPCGFPADFIAEGIDQTRGWFYTLTVLSAALFKKPAFHHCIVNGTVLAENGLKMSKRLKNYPDPNELMEEHGADALRFALMSSPAVRAEDLRFSGKFVEETVRSVLLPLWNSYSFFVTYANAAGFEAATTPRPSAHPLDRWIKAEVQDLVNRMTEQMDNYDLSATCKELFDTIDALTNWYIRLSRRRFAGKGGDMSEAYGEGNDVDRQDALTTLHEVLITLSQLLAPFCPFITESIYLNLVGEKHGSIHLTNWPATRELEKTEALLLGKNRVLRLIVSLGNKIRSEKKIKNRQPLAKVTIALPSSLFVADDLTTEDLQLLRQELNVKEVAFTKDPAELGTSIAMVDARKVGPRLGKRVQEVIQAGKNSEFTVEEDGGILILDERLSPDEVQILYKGREGEDMQAQDGVVVSLDTRLTDELIGEGLARDIVRAIQKLRKDTGLLHTDTIELSVSGIDEVMARHGALIAQETNASLGTPDSEPMTIMIEDISVSIRFKKI